MYCTHCGSENPVGANFCGNCGHPLAGRSATTSRHDETTEFVQSSDARDVDARDVDARDVDSRDVDSRDLAESRPSRTGPESDDATGRAREVRGEGEAADLEHVGLADASAIVNELERGTALLVSVRGPNRGARFLLDREVVTVGRHPDSDIFLDDITVSRRHAEFRRDGNRYWIHDVGSLNGTYVNSRRADDQLVATGDEIQIGKFKLVAFVAEPAG